MLDRGANPYIRDAEGVTHFDRYSLFNLKNLPSVKGVPPADENGDIGTSDRVG